MAPLIDGEFEEIRDDSSQIAHALTAGGAPVYPPAAWYGNPNFTRPTPFKITPEGKISGHIAAWGTNHIGLPPGTRPPRSRADYAFFKTGAVKTAEGTEVPVGQITLAGGHAPLSADAGAAVAHYDKTESAVADVTVGEDSHGIWVTGGLRPSVTDEQIRAIRGSAPSGDWRVINGALELVAVCQVNTPGFPVARAMVASGDVTALVAAGAAHMYELQREEGELDSLAALAARVQDLEATVAAAVPRKKVREGAAATTEHGWGSGDSTGGSASDRAALAADAPGDLDSDLDDAPEGDDETVPGSGDMSALDNLGLIIEFADPDDGDSGDDDLYDVPDTDEDMDTGSGAFAAESGPDGSLKGLDTEGGLEPTGSDALNSPLGDQGIYDDTDDDGGASSAGADAMDQSAAAAEGAADGVNDPQKRITARKDRLRQMMAASR